MKVDERLTCMVSECTNNKKSYCVAEIIDIDKFGICRSSIIDKNKIGCEQNEVSN